MLVRGGERFAGLRFPTLGDEALGMGHPAQAKVIGEE
jgi:hypothetical protein